MFKHVSCGVCVGLLLVCCRSPARAQSYAESQTIVADDGERADLFGSAVSLSGRRALIGAGYDDEGKKNTGSAYLFERSSDGTWRRIRKLTASDAGENDQFGYGSVSLSGDRALIGAANADEEAGAAYLFEPGENGEWTEVHKFTAGDGEPGDSFGASVAVSGEWILIGANNNKAKTGAAYLFARNHHGEWTEVQKLTAADARGGDQFGWSVALSGNRALIGSRFDDVGKSNTGSAYLFEREGDGVWRETQKLSASDAERSDLFGWSVALSGDFALVGATRDDVGDQRDCGSVSLYRRTNSGQWTEVVRLTASDADFNDSFGNSVALSDSVAVVGAVDHNLKAGAAYVFERTPGGDWKQIAKLTHSDSELADMFGCSVAVSDDVVLIGAFRDDAVDRDAGSAVFFERR